MRSDALENAIAKAGFELLGLELEVRGRLGRARGPTGDEFPSLKVESTGQSFALLEGDSDREHEAWARLSPHLDREGAAVWVRGGVHRHEEGPTGLLVNDFRMQDE